MGILYLLDNYSCSDLELCAVNIFAVQQSAHASRSLCHCIYCTENCACFTWCYRLFQTLIKKLVDHTIRRGRIVYECDKQFVTLFDYLVVSKGCITGRRILSWHPRSGLNTDYQSAREVVWVSTRSFIILSSMTRDRILYARGNSPMQRYFARVVNAPLVFEQEDKSRVWQLWWDVLTFPHHSPRVTLSPSEASEL